MHITQGWTGCGKCTEGWHCVDTDCGALVEPQSAHIADYMAGYYSQCLPVTFTTTRQCIPPTSTT